MTGNYVLFKLNFLDALSSGIYFLIELTIKSYKTKLLEDINSQWNYCVNKSFLPLVASVLRAVITAAVVNYLQCTEIPFFMLHSLLIVKLSLRDEQKSLVQWVPSPPRALVRTLMRKGLWNHRGNTSENRLGKSCFWVHCVCHVLQESRSYILSEQKGV